MLILSTSVDKKSLDTEFLIAICPLTGDKWQSKTLFLAIFDPCSSIVKSIFNCRLSGVLIYTGMQTEAGIIPFLVVIDILKLLIRQNEEQEGCFNYFVNIFTGAMAETNNHCNLKERNIFLAHLIRISEILAIILPWDRISYLSHAILPRVSSNAIM